ncbi:MAG: shikimate kinase [Eggerthellaceae bacterium]|nr:shikimate kinase [Eggerthellaceae bacterium]
MKEKLTEPGKDNVVLIGMPGAGKSTLGVVLAKIMGYNFLDADLLIQNQCDRTLQRLIDACGPEGFIQVENQVLSDISAERTVIATGGSAVYSEAAMKHLSEIGRIVYLQISYDELKARLTDFQERGVVLKGGVGMSLRDLYAERLPLYEEYADYVVNVDDLTITAAARKVADALK